MTQEDKELLLKDICARLPYNVIINCTDSDTDYNCFLTTDIVNELFHNIEYYNYKPYLRPMSSMTEEEIKEFTSITENVLVIGKKYTSILDIDSINWLNEHHFDYRGLIEKGLAIEVKEENNPYKT